MYVLYLDLDLDAVEENTGLDSLDTIEAVDDQLEDLGFEKIGRGLYFTKEDLTAVHDAVDTLTSLEMLTDAVMNALIIPTSEISDFTEYFDSYEDEADEDSDEEDGADADGIEIEIK